MTKKASNTQHALLCGVSIGSQERGNPSQNETFHRLTAWSHPQNGKQAKAFLTEGEGGKEAHYLGDVTQKLSEKSWSQRAPKGHGSFSLITTWLYLVNGQQL